jgi:hypothetical protein
MRDVQPATRYAQGGTVSGRGIGFWLAFLPGAEHDERGFSIDGIEGIGSGGFLPAGCIKTKRKTRARIMAEQPFKECPSCRRTWPGYADFLDDPAIHLIGYQVFFDDQGGGLFLFNHSCGTTLSIDVDSLQPLYNGPLYAKSSGIGAASCPGLCLVREGNRPCPENCECASVRVILQRIKQWRKRGEGRG